MYKNPIIYCDYSDPDAIRVGEDYYMVASSFSNTPALPILHSKDLIHWELINYCLDNITEARYDDAVHGCGVWAPAIRYNDGKYYVYFPMPDEGIYVTYTSDPYGKWSEPINIRPGAGWIDPCPFWDDDGKAYLVAGVAKSRIGYKSVLHMVEMAPDGLSLIGEEVKVFDGNENDQTTIEGPKMYKRNGYYYIFAPAGGVKPGWQTVLRSRNVYGPYEYKVVLRQGMSDINGPHQGAWVDTEGGEDWFIHFQDVYSAGRITLLEPMKWEHDWPVMGDNGEAVRECKLPNVSVKDWNVTLPTSDDFKNGYGLQWQWNANHYDYFYDKTDEGLKLLSVCKEACTPLGDAPNLFLQKWPAPEFNVYARLSLKDLAVGDFAGMISLGMDYGAIGFMKNEDAFDIIKVMGNMTFKNSIGHTTEEKECIGKIKESEIELLYTVRKGETTVEVETVKFFVEDVKMYIKIDGEYKELLSMKACPGRWVGVKNGFFAVNYEGQRRDSGLIIKNVEYQQ